MANGTAHRAVGHVQFFGCLGKTQVAGSGLEAWQGIERR
jgi:hypothetical protein